MKKLYPYIIVAFLMPAKLWAQPGVGATYIGDYSKMSSKSTMDAEMETGNWIYRLENLKGGKYNFRVTMKDNSVREVRSKIYADSSLNKSYLIYDDQANAKQKIYCNETLAISRITNSEVVNGVVTDSCWLFKVVSGKINGYSFFPEADGPFSLIAYQTGNSAVKYFDLQWLDEQLRNDPKAYKAFIKKDYIKALERYNATN